MLTLIDPRHAQPDASSVSVKPISPSKSQLDESAAITRFLLVFPNTSGDLRKELEARRNDSGE